MLPSEKMIVRLANRSSHALPKRTPQLLRRHQSTGPAHATPALAPAPAQPLQAQQRPQAQVAKHPSAVEHPALRDQPPQRGNDNSIVFIFGGLLLGGLPLSYWYWGYRQRAMRQKKEEMLRGIQERYAARHGGG